MDDAGAWDSLDPPLHSDVLQAVEQKLHFAHMAPVQAATIPCMLRGEDVSVQAETGSGKTLAFLLPLLHLLIDSRDTSDGSTSSTGVFALVISPTRELASQTHATLASLQLCSSLLLIGGVQDVQEDIMQFQQHGAEVIVATPGRLLDFMSRTAPHWAECGFLVLDEADRLLEMGFSSTLDAVIAFLPSSRVTGLFSATQTSEVKMLARAGMKHPLRITVQVEGGNETDMLPQNLRNWYQIVPRDQKLVWLASFIRYIVLSKKEKVIVFCLTCASVNFLYAALRFVGSLADADIVSLHGKIPSKKRPPLLKKFGALESGALITTDVAARGLDLPGLQWVVQWDAPQDPTQFNHRVGRTARAGTEGDAVLAVTPRESTYVQYLQDKGIHTLEMPPIDPLPEADTLIEMMRQRSATDREFWEKGLLAYVSYTRGYREHVCDWIFSNLDYGELAYCFGLATLPSMPELKGQSALQNWKPVDVLAKNIPYRNAARERTRLANMAAAKAKRNAREEKKRVRLKRKKKSLKGVGNATTQHAFDYDEVADISKEAKLLKLLKRKKITEEEFDQRVAQIHKSADQSQIQSDKQKEKRRQRRNKKKGNKKPKIST